MVKVEGVCSFGVCSLGDLLSFHSHQPNLSSSFKFSFTQLIIVQDKQIEYASKINHVVINVSVQRAPVNLLGSLHQLN